MAETTPIPPEEQPTQKSKRDLVRERLAQKYADKSFDDDEALYGQINDDYDSYENELQGLRSDEEKLISLMNSDPRSARFLRAWMEGGDPLTVLIREYGDDFMEQLQDPEKQEELAQASRDFAQRMAEDKEFVEQRRVNTQQSLSDIEMLEQEEGIAPEEIDDAVAFLVQVARDSMLCKFTPENIRMALKALHHDEDMAEADAEGEIRGRNATIKDRLRKSRQGDGMPNMGGKNSRTKQQKRPQSILEVASEASW